LNKAREEGFGLSRKGMLCQQFSAPA